MTTGTTEELSRAHALLDRLADGQTDMRGQVQAAQLASLQPAPVWMVWLQ